MYSTEFKSLFTYLPRQRSGERVRLGIQRLLPTVRHYFSSNNVRLLAFFVGCFYHKGPALTERCSGIDFLYVFVQMNMIVYNSSLVAHWAQGQPFMVIPTNCPISVAFYDAHRDTEDLFSS